MSIYTNLTDDELVKLEKLIDLRGMANVMRGVAIICEGKAEHVESPCGEDDSVAKIWGALAVVAEFAASVVGYLP